VGNSSGSTLKDLHVLILEDEADTRELLAFLLQAEGAEVFPAQSVNEALQALQQHRPDVIVADIGLPEYNGYAFIAALRKHEDQRLRSTPVIALTAFSTAADRDTALVSGFDVHLGKPFEPVELIATLRRLYDSRVHAAA